VHDSVNMAISMKLEVLSTLGTRVGRLMERMPDGVTQPRRRSLLSCGSLRTVFDAGGPSALVGGFASIAFAPVAANRVTGAGEPFLVAPKLFQRRGREEFGAVTRRTAEWF